MSKFWSPLVHRLTPYVPGEQPKLPNLVKLNTNENPYPPSPKAVAAMQAVHFLGIPEGDQALAQAAIYLALAQKSDAAYQALNAARDTVQRAAADPVPLHLRNPVTSHMKQWGYGEGYQHAHQFEGAITDMECLPPSLVGTRFYHPTGRGLEKRIAERIEEIRKAKER